MTSAASGAVMTNKGPRSGRKPTLDPLPASMGGQSDGDIFLRSSSPTALDAVERSRPSHSKLLPPMAKSSDALESVHLESQEAASPTRRGRQKALVAHGEGVRSVLAASLEVDQMEKDMALVRENRRDAGNVLLELWVNQVLDPAGSPPSGMNPNATEPLKVDVAMMKGLIAYGLTRTELLGAGLHTAAVDRLYRGLYVYTIGFFDIMQDILHNSEFRMEILSNVWRAYLYIAESALKVAFKSDYLTMFQAQQITAAELLVAKEALAEARVDSYKTEKALCWLTSAHAEERALRVALRQDVEEAQTSLERERRAHQAAVQKYVAEAELRSKYHLEIESLNARVEKGTLAAAELIMQRDEAQKERDTMESDCVQTLERLVSVYTALTMDESLVVGRPENVETELAGLQGMRAKASEVADLTELLYDKWREEKTGHRAAATNLYVVKDKLRASVETCMITQDALDKSQKDCIPLRAELEQQVLRGNGLQESLDKSSAGLHASTKEKKAGLAEIERLNGQVVHLEKIISDMVNQREDHQANIAELSNTLGDRDGALADLQKAFAEAKWVSAQLSKGLSVSMGALYSNQVARKHLQTQVLLERAAQTDVGKLLEGANRMVRLLEGKVGDLTAEITIAQIEADRLAHETRLNTDLLTESMRLLAESQAKNVEMTAEVKASKLKIMKVETELHQKMKLLEQAKETLGFEKTEVLRLYKSLQNLEEKLRSISNERLDVIKKMERVMQDMAALQDKFKRKEEMLNLEIKRIQSEVRLERTRSLGLDLQLETTRKKIGELQDSFNRKREKKRKWKGLYTVVDSNGAHLKSMLDERDASIMALEQRLAHLDVDIAILVADRGRKPPHYGEVGTRPGDGGSSDGSPPGTASSGRPPLTPDTPMLPAMLLEILPAATASGPVPDTMDGVKNLISTVYQQWDQANHCSLKLQMQLNEANKGLEVSRTQYERARAIFYGNPTDLSLKERMAAKEEELAAVRETRAKVEEQLDAVGNYCRTLQGKLRHYEQKLSTKRMDEIEWRTATREDAMRTELSCRVDDAEQRARDLQNMLATQKAAYDMLEATRTTLEGEIQKQELELKNLSMRLAKITEEKIEGDMQMKAARERMSTLQTDLGHMTDDRDNFKHQLFDAEHKIVDLNDELEDSRKSVELNLKRIEQKYGDEKRETTKAAAAIREELSARITAKSQDLATMSALKLQLETLLKVVVVNHLSQQETSDPPTYMQHFLPEEAFVSAAALIPSIVPKHNFLLDDPVTQYVVPVFDTTMVIISQIFTDKMVADLATEELLLGGIPGVRCCLLDKTYDYFLSRYGARQPSEMHLCAFLDSVRRFRSHHSKIRNYARLIGFQDEGESALPPGAEDFYLGVFNRMHARAGPLVAEAAEGYSQVKCKILAKAFREMLRGAFSTLHEGAAGMTERLRALAMNDEEKYIDLEQCMEMILKAWEVQYKSDYDAIVITCRHCFEKNKSSFVTPDDFMKLLQKLEPARALIVSPREAHAMYRRAMRSSGPSGKEGGPGQMAEAVLYYGFVGLGSGRYTRLELVRTLPPFDEFRILEESWKNMRSVVEVQLGVLTERKSVLRVNTDSYIEVCRELELALEARHSSEDAWCHFRTVMALHTTHRSAVDKITPFVRPRLSP